jgi:hypothetical protein
MTGCLKKAVKSTFDGNFSLQNLMKIDLLERYWAKVVLEHLNLSLCRSKSQYSTPLSLCGTEMDKFLEDSCVSHFSAIPALLSKLSGNKTVTDAKSQTQNDLSWHRKVNRA